MFLDSRFSDPDFHPSIPLEPELDLKKEGFEVVELGVRKLVEALWISGFKTVCSCAGHKDALEPYPWVVIPIKNPNALFKLTKMVAEFNKSLGKDGKMPRALETWTLNPNVSPSGFSIYLCPFDSNQRKSERKISKLRKASEALAAFILLIKKREIKQHNI